MLVSDRRKHRLSGNRRRFGAGLIVLALSWALVAVGSATASASSLRPAGHPAAHGAVTPQGWPAGSRLVNPGLTLLPGGAVTSPNGRANLALGDVSGTLFVYDELGNTRWRAAEIRGTRASFQKDCNLVVYAGNQPLWASNTSGIGVCTLAVQSDGNVVIYELSGAFWWPVWATNTQH
jgi:hypothetical protein